MIRLDTGSIRPHLFLILCAVLLLGVMVLHLLWGLEGITNSKFFSEIFFPTQLPEPILSIEQVIFKDVRLPRTIAGLIAGFAFSVAGVLCQGTFQNELASPSVLGISAGAAFFVILAYVFNFISCAWYFLPLVAFLGALSSLLSLSYFFLLRRKISMGELLLVGFAISTIFGAGASLGLRHLIPSPIKAGEAMSWLLGNISIRPLSMVLTYLPAVILLLGLSLFLSRPLDTLSLGDEVSESLGYETRILRLKVITLICLLEATGLSLAGVVPFVGLIVPHIARSFIGPKHRNLILASGILGSILLLCADFLGRMASPPKEIELGVIFSFIGAPFFIYLVLRNRKAW